MPGTYKRSQKKRTEDSELKFRIIAALNEAEEGDLTTTDWIKSHDITLAPYTGQKLSRALNNLIEMGLVVKGKSKSLNRMVYRLKAKMKDAGYSFEQEPRVSRPYYGREWDIEDEQSDDSEIDETEY